MKARSILPKLMTKTRIRGEYSTKNNDIKRFYFHHFQVEWYKRRERKICKNIIDYNTTTSTTGSEEKSSHVGIDESNCRSYVDECT